MRARPAAGYSNASWVPSFIPVSADGLPGLVFALLINAAWALGVVLPVLAFYAFRRAWRRRTSR